LLALLPNALDFIEQIQEKLLSAVVPNVVATKPLQSAWSRAATFRSCSTVSLFSFAAHVGVGQVQEM
jgi:hypothetical protein